MQSNEFLRRLNSMSEIKLNSDYQYKYLPVESIIYEQQDESPSGDRCCLLLDGRVKIVREIGGVKRSVGWAAPGDILGFESLLGIPRKATAIVVEPAQVLSYDPSFLELAEELINQQEIAVVLAHRMVSARLAIFILWWAERYGNPIPIWFRHQEMADIIGSKRETVTTHLLDFRKRGIISIVSRYVEVLDWRMLRRVAYEIK